MYEVESINKELARLRKKTRELGARKRGLLDKAADNLIARDETRIEHKGKVYNLVEKKLTTRKSNKDKKADAMNVITHNGFYGRDAEELLDQISAAFKGPEQTRYTIQ